MPKRKREDNSNLYPRFSKRLDATVWDVTVTVEGRQKVSRGHLTPDAARLVRDALKVDMRRGVLVAAPAKITVGELVDKWLQSHTPGLRNEDSRDTYRFWAKSIKADKFGENRLARLTKLDVTVWKATLQSRYGSTNTAHDVFACFRRIITWALDNELIGKDVTRGTTAPKKVDRNPPVLPIETVRHLLALATKQEQPAEIMVWLGVRAGIRFSEIVSLGWDQVDIHDRTLRLNRLQAETHGGTVKAGEQPIRLDPEDVEYLSAYHLEQMRIYEAKGLPAPRLVCLRADGATIKAPWWWWRWNAIREAAGVPWLHFHDLRHVNATLLARAGVHPKVAQQRLGHSSEKMTSIYTHTTAEMQDDAATKLRELLKKGDS